MADTSGMVQTDKSKIACFTGHRIIGGAEIKQLQENLENTLNDLIEKGVFSYLSGGAIGFDTLAAQYVLRAREENPNIKLIMALPCHEHESRWR